MLNMVKKDKPKAKQEWVKQKLASKGKDIIAKYVEYRDKEFIHRQLNYVPSGYQFLKRKMFEDQIIDVRAEKSKTNNKNVSNKNESIQDRLNRVTSGIRVKGNVIDSVVVPNILQEFKE